MNISERKFELDLDLQAQAIVLANPQLETITINSMSVCILSMFYEPGPQEDYHDNGVSVYLLNSEFALYDSGCLVINGRPLRAVPPDFFEKEIQDKLNLKNNAEHVTFKTGDDGQIIVDVSHFRLGCPLPQGVNHPTVSLSELRRQPYEIYLDSVVNVVKVASGSSNNTQSYAFRKIDYTERFSTHSAYSDTDIHPLLGQAQFLLTHSLPFVIEATALVIDSSGDFRGYLMPFHPARSLDKVLERLLISMKPDLMLDSKHGPEPASLTPADDDDISVARNEGAGMEGAQSHPYPMALQWCLKLAWVLDIVQAVSALHTAMICCGDIKLENVVVCVDGHCRLIDLRPGDLGFSMAYLAPEITALLQSTEDDPVYFLTLPRDVFAVGMLLWALAEEIGSFERKDPLFSPSLVWSSSTPLWYRELVDHCIAQEPGDRPSVRSVLELLSEHWIQ
ncbi:kinase-like domain-containing protein [Rhodocollybia butyracea]|uniref:Kinase-like domain-containing protein n=1 Tax=Rhodocollybia butyracea TaxID=206335 RepID=A0A9P5UGK6_9AGAR|nr:kinase-like domain-containing protein [Rhodocollybia butyracea]